MKLETKLKDRILRFDGVCAIHPDDIPYFLYHGVPPNKIHATVMDDSVTQFNDQVDEEDAIKPYDSKKPIAINLAWQVPDQYLQIDLTTYFTDLFLTRLPELGYSEEQTDLAADRIAAELEEVENRGMVEFMQTIIYILDKFRETGQVWGVGRGSSCACYLLFLIGLHMVDSIIMDVDMDEFFHD